MCEQLYGLGMLIDFPSTPDAVYKANVAVEDNDVFLHTR